MNTVVSISFEVTYRFDEYLSIVSEYVLFRRNKRAGKRSMQFEKASRLPWYTRIELSLTLPLVFRYKVKKVGTCTFQIDDQQIQRSSKLGLFRLPWRDVVAIHRFSHGYLVEKAKGAVPLPYRCLTEEKAAILDELIRRRERELEDGLPEGAARLGRGK